MLLQRTIVPQFISEALHVNSRLWRMHRVFLQCKWVLSTLCSNVRTINVSTQVEPCFFRKNKMSNTWAHSYENITLSIAELKYDQSECWLLLEERNPVRNGQQNLSFYVSLEAPLHRPLPRQGVCGVPPTPWLCHYFYIGCTAATFPPSNSHLTF